MTKTMSVVQLLWVIVSAMFALLLIVLVAPFMFNGPSNKEQLCAEFVYPGSKVHSSRPYRNRDDAMIIAYYETPGRTYLHYSGCAFKGNRVDPEASKTMFDDEIREYRQECMRFRVSLAPHRLQGTRWANDYPSREPTEDEVKYRKSVCDHEDARYFILQKLRWR